MNTPHPHQATEVYMVKTGDIRLNGASGVGSMVKEWCSHFY